MPLLVAAGLAFIAQHVLYIETRLLHDWPFSLEADNGVPEAFQYVKTILAGTVHGGHISSRATGVYIGWAVVFTSLLLDDVLQFHEQIGKSLGKRMHCQSRSNCVP
jgi:hypothetical protein